MYSIGMALIAVMVKKLSHFPLMEIILFRNIPTMIIVPGMIKKTNVSPFGNNKLVLCFSDLVTVVALITGFYTIKLLNY